MLDSWAHVAVPLARLETTSEMPSLRKNTEGRTRDSGARGRYSRGLSFQIQICKQGARVDFQVNTGFVVFTNPSPIVVEEMGSGRPADRPAKTAAAV